MKKTSIFSLAALPFIFASCVDNKVDTQPNIILFMVDDMGWEDTSLPFWTQRTHLNDRFETPNMERLASQGIIFTQAYSSSISSPTRCSLMTGCNAARHRVTNWTLQRDHSEDHPDNQIKAPDWNYNGICQDGGINNTFQATSFVQILQDNDYHTIHCGKAHFAANDTPGADPLHFGFDVNIAGHAAGGPASYLGEKNYGHDENGVPLNLFATSGLEKYWNTNTFLTEALTLEAIHAIDSAKSLDKPFFLYMAHYAVHVPWNRDLRYFQKYKDKGLSDNQAAYASLVEGMDKSLGDIMNYLEINGLSKNTIIIFMSDNGGLTSESVNIDDLWQSNYPLNGGKGSAYEGGIRVPMIVKWSGTVEPATKCDDYIIIEDFYPTILEMAQINDYQTIQQIDGVSFISHLKGKKNASKGRDIFWNSPNVWNRDCGHGIGPSCTVRSGDWKLIYFYKTGDKEIYNIKNDIGELNNLADIELEIKDELSKKLADYLRSVNAQVPSFKGTGFDCPLPDEY